MFTWISDRLVAGALAALALVTLGGCLPGVAPSSDASSVRPALLSGAAPERLRVAGGDVVVAGPAGYCVDKRASRPNASTAFVLLASCSSITGNPAAPRPSAPALLTASVTGQAPGGATLADQAPLMQRFFASEQGRAALARDGQAQSVEILGMGARSGSFVLHLRDQSKGVVPGLRPDYWRAIFEAGGRMVTASVMTFQDRPISSDAAQQTLLRTVAKIRAESAGVDAVAASDATAAAVETAPRPKARN